MKYILFSLLFFARTLKKGCPFAIKFTLDKSGQFFVVKEVSNEHNHKIDRVRAFFSLEFFQ